MAGGVVLTVVWARSRYDNVEMPGCFQSISTRSMSVARKWDTAGMAATNASLGAP